MRELLFAVAAVAVAALAGCGQGSPKLEQAAASACADDGPTFAGTNICVGRSVNYIDPEVLATLPPLRSGCEWAPGATTLSETQALLYMAATCNGQPTTFQYVDGKLSYASGEMYVEGQSPLIEIFDTPEADALAPLREKIAALPAAEGAGCVIQSAGLSGPLAQAVVIGPTPAVKAQAPTNEPNAYCGDYGLNEDEASFWLVRQGKAMFFQLGQEQQDIDAASVTLLQKDADGNWSAAEPYARGPLGECLLQVGGKTYLDGVCETSTSEDGSFQVFGKDYFAYAGALEDGKFNVSWNESPENTHAGAVLGEDFTAKDGCLTGAKGTVCRWDLGARP